MPSIRTTSSIIAGSLAATMMMHHAHGSDLLEPAEDLDGTSEVLEFPQIVTLQGWRYDELYLRSTSADDLIDDVAVFGASGEQIGYTEDLIMGVEGEVLALIVEIGGFWDIGDTHVSIPGAWWNLVQMV